MFVKIKHFRAVLLFVGKARSMPLEWKLFRAIRLVGSSHALKSQARAKVSFLTNTLAYDSIIEVTKIKFCKVRTLVLMALFCAPSKVQTKSSKTRVS